MAEYVIGKVDEFPSGTAVAVQAGRRTVAIIRTDDPASCATSGRNTRRAHAKERRSLSCAVTSPVEARRNP